MHYHESVTNTVAKRGNGSEMSKWRDAGVDPELLYDVVPLSDVRSADKLAPNVAEWDKTLLAREAARQSLVTTVTVEQA